MEQSNHFSGNPLLSCVRPKWKVHATSSPNSFIRYTLFRFDLLFVVLTGAKVERRVGNFALQIRYPLMAQYRSIFDPNWFLFHLLLLNRRISKWGAKESLLRRKNLSHEGLHAPTLQPRKNISTKAAGFKGRILPTALNENTCDSFVGLVFWVILIHHNTTYSVWRSPFLSLP